MLPYRAGLSGILANRQIQTNFSFMTGQIKRNSLEWIFWYKFGGVRLSLLFVICTISAQSNLDWNQSVDTSL